VDCSYSTHYFETNKQLRAGGGLILQKPIENYG